MVATQRENPLSTFWAQLGSAQKGTLILNLETLLAEANGGKPPHALAPAAASLGKLVRTTRTRVIVISERSREESSVLIPDPSSNGWARNGSGRSHLGTFELISGVQDTAEVVTRLARESNGLPLAYLGKTSADEPAFHALIGGVGLGILVRSNLRLTAARALLRPPEELLQFFEDWGRFSQPNGAIR